MKFEKGVAYHIYNQGNNRRQIFLNRDNYFYFLGKMKNIIAPFGDFICYCLMPNHFHLLFRVEHLELPMKMLNVQSKRVDREVSLNDAIGIALRSYTRAINKRNGWSGSLFREETKAKDGCIEEFITVDSRHWNMLDYLSYCFNYIHENPVEAGLVRKAVDWEFSSAKDYAGISLSSFCNLELGRQIVTG